MNATGKGDMARGGYVRALTGVLLMLIGVGAFAETIYGPAITLQGGSARTYLVNDNGAPVEVGVALNEAFLAGLPGDGAQGGIVMADGHSTFEYVLQMPKPNPTPFQHVTLDWNPAGHDPQGVYDRPHFDFHFYTISNKERQGIQPGDEQFLPKAKRLPSPESIPSGYIDPGLPPVPAMGVHLLNPTSPELRKDNPQPFTHTFIYGTWDGRLIFVEPMVTQEFLAGRPDLTVSIPVAERYSPKGHYPGAYMVRWDEESSEYRVGLTDLKMR